MNTVLYIVIPCYNEEKVLPITAPMFLKEITTLAEAGKISNDSRILFVNDGSRDSTWRSYSPFPSRIPITSASARAGTGGTRTRCWRG